MVSNSKRTMRESPCVSFEASHKFSKQCKDAAGKANRMLGFINRNISLKTKDVMLPQYTSLVRSHMKYTAQFWTPHHAKDITKLEAVQRSATNYVLA